MYRLKAFLGMFLVLASINFMGVNRAYAQEVPNFPSCSNPQGQVIAQYSDGFHGVVGRTDTYQGSDNVYKVSEGAVTQCFCADNGQGVQTDWWKTSLISEDQAQSFTNQGWIYAPNGALWGLDESPYFAKNTDFSCQGSNQNSGSGGGNSSTDSSSAGVGGASAILSASIVSDVLGLADTGNISVIIIWALLGLISLTAGLTLYRKIS
jgi:hypothetical protein